MIFSRTTKRSTVLDRMEMASPADESLEADMIVDIPTAPPSPPAAPRTDDDSKRDKLSAFEKEYLAAWAEQ